MKKRGFLLFAIFFLLIFFILKQFPLSKRTSFFSSKINRLLPEPQASLLNGILWGEKAKMPKDLYLALQKTATLHVVALSGMNITILLNLISDFLLIFSRKTACLLGILVIFVFIWFVGAPISAIRAGIMGSLSLIAVYFGKKEWSLLSLILTGGIMLIYNFSWFKEISFQLSFLATLGIILFSPQKEKRKQKGIIQEFFYEAKENFRTTLAAQIFTMPITFYNFGQISLIGPFTNALILWVIQPIMILGFILAFISVIFYPLAVPLSWIIWVPLTYFIEVVKITSKIPFTQIIF